MQSRSLARLGFQYLWIDSLCIIQGDEQDWIAESVKMTSVYAKAFIVIAASGARDGDGGCFIGSAAEPRSASDKGVLMTQCPGPNGQESHVYARRSRYYGVPTVAASRGGEAQHGWKSAFGQPLEARGWTYQEEELATRVLYYTEDEVRWRCSEVNACECLGTRKSVGSASSRLRLAQFSDAAVSSGCGQ